MPPTDAPSLDTGLDITSRPIPVFATLTRIVAMALPFMLGAVVTSALNLGKIAVLAHTGQTLALGTLSLLQPAFILALALMEGLAITNQVFSARSKFNWPRRGILGATRALSIYAIVLLAVLSGAAFALDRLVTFQSPVIGEMMRNLPLYLLSLVPFVLFDICYGALRGQGRLVGSLVPFAAVAVIDLGVTYILCKHYGWGFNAVLAGNVAGALAMLPVIVWLLYRAAGDGPAVPAGALKARLRQLLLVVGGPLALSILAGSVSAALIFPMLADMGRDHAAGFMVVMRFRILFMIPAIAFGSVIAILMNQEVDTASGPGERVRYLLIGVPVLLAAYAGLTYALPYYSQPVIDLLLSHRTDGTDLRAVTDLMLRGLQITFFLIAGAAMLQVILEQLERAVQVLALTILTEAATFAAMFYTLRHGGGLDDVLLILRAVAAANFALLFILLLWLLARTRRPDAV